MLVHVQTWAIFIDERALIGKAPSDDAVAKATLFHLAAAASLAASPLHCSRPTMRSAPPLYVEGGRGEGNAGRPPAVWMERPASVRGGGGFT